MLNFCVVVFERFRFVCGWLVLYLFRRQSPLCKNRSSLRSRLILHWERASNTPLSELGVLFLLSFLSAPFPSFRFISSFLPSFLFCLSFLFRFFLLSGMVYRFLFSFFLLALTTRGREVRGVDTQSNLKGKLFIF